MKTILILFVILPAVIFAQDVKDGGSVRRADSLRQVRHVGEQGLIIMPGARTLPQGVFAVDVFGIVSYNFLYAVTPSTQIGLFSLIPVVPDFEYTVTLNVKQNVYESCYFSAAAYGNINFKAGFYMAGGILTFGPVDYNFNAGYLHAVLYRNGLHDGILLLGAKTKILKSFYFIAEYSNFKSSIMDLDKGFKGLGTAGFRFYAGTGCFEIGASVPLIEIGDETPLVMPIAKGMLYF
ncbi:MAG TPA: hypothetical protein VHO28_05065 [Ignavibacteriales bacterium]|nr:hypothetical protein [Ignavibacteriales bacterium]